DGEDVRVLQPRGELDLTQEAISPERGGQRRLQHLERDRAAVLEVAGEIHGGHAALAELPLDQVSVGQGSLQRDGRAGHPGEYGPGSGGWPDGEPPGSASFIWSSITRPGRLPSGWVARRPAPRRWPRQGRCRPCPTLPCGEPSTSPSAQAWPQGSTD